MMILSAEYSHSQDKMATPCLPQSVLTTRHSVYSGYLMDTMPTWHHPMKQEPEESSVNNDSGISPSHYSDGSIQNTSPQSFQSEARSDDSGHADREDQNTNTTLGVLARPIMETTESPQNASIGIFAQTVLGEQPQQHGSSPHHSISPHQHMTPPQSSSPQQEHCLSPCGLSPQQHSTFRYHQSVHPLPQSPPAGNCSPQPSCSYTSQVTAAPQGKPTDDNSRSSASSAEMNMYYEDPLKSLQMSLQKRGMIGPIMPELPVNGEKPLQCPLCEYFTTIRSAFNNHLMSEHSEQVSCYLCEFKAENHFKLREHLRVEHDVQPEDDPSTWGEDDEPGVTTPKVNSQGKVKTYRCKQCEFSTITKLEFWEHTRGHIKPERLLTCPKCPFVTEYKHHLEYHLRNHFGSKPFKCDKCSYSCVNKSMLNSHLKSHSNIYQFRCFDCAYATKYCHSLKLHLRKYNHKPAVVLNPDGSENPLPIVDVYGTRRGPKRPKKTEEGPSPQLCAVPSLHPIFSNPYGFMPGQTMPYPYNTLITPFSRNKLIPYPSNPMMQDQHTPPKTEPENSLYNTAISNIQQSTIDNNQEGVKEYLTRVISTQQDIIARNSTAEIESQNAETSHGGPLDLSRPEPEPQEPAAETVSQTNDQSSVTKSRRKGKAVKLERIAQRLQQQSSEEDDNEPRSKQKFNMSSEQPKANKEDESGLADSEDNDPSMPKVDFSEEERAPEERKKRWRKVREVHDCPFCDLLFGDVVLYTMHMGYHGYQDPFTCNICGHQTTDRIQFTLHLFRHPHN